MSNEQGWPSGTDPARDPMRALCSAYLMLQAQAQANCALRREIEVIKASRSWRLTAPLRRLRSWLGQPDAAPAALPPAPAVPAARLPEASALLFNRVLPSARPERPVANRQLLVDVSELAREDLGAGVQRVVWRILLELLVDPPSGFRVEPVRLTCGDAGYVHARAFLGRMLGLKAGEAGSDQAIAVAPGDVFLGLDLIRDHADKAAPALRAMREQGVSVNFVVYDLLPLLHPEWFPTGMGERFRRWVRLVAEVADRALCISDTVCAELREALAHEAPTAATRLSSFPLGSDLDSWLAPGAGLQRPMSGVARFLMVGTVEPRKGHAQVLDAFERLWGQGEDCELLIVGHAGWAAPALVERLRNHVESGRRLRWIEAGGDADLLAAYRDSTALLAASCGEGFGLPLVEAAAHGLPILARDIPVFREVAGAGADYFTGCGTDDLADALTAWLRRWRSGSVADSSLIRRHTWRGSADELKRILAGA